MADQSAIEWTDATWNPIVGCDIVSPGCTNCYAMGIAARIERMAHGETHYAGSTKTVKDKPVWTGKLALAPDHILTAPLRWRKPRRIFVNSMGDLFHKSVPDEWIDPVFAVMALTPHHTHQVLTKRSDRMRKYLSHGDFAGNVRSWLNDRGPGLGLTDQQIVAACAAISDGPLANVWLGVSAEDQKRADMRIPDLLATPAAVRWVSAEPLLGPIDFSRYLWPVHGWWRSPHRSYAEAKAAGAVHGLKRQALVSAHARFLDWIVVGGESGAGARPMHPDWARSIRDQCKAAVAPFFFKQWGNWAEFYDRDRDDPDWRRCPTLDNQMGPGAERYHNLAGGIGFHGERVVAMRNVGKKNAGRLLDGVEHNAMPEARAC